MFEKNLNDLVRGIRNTKNNEAKYINQCFEEIKQELRQENMNLKANAVSKLVYLEMHGYDISWAAFNIIEVMSSTKLTHKRIGYLGAAQCFHEELDVLMLTTNLIKKDMCSQNQYDAGVAINGLSVFITPDLARDLANDAMNLMVSSRPYIRKKSALLMYKVFLNFPEALRPAFPRLKDKLEDQDGGVQCSAVNVICELARKNPRNYLSLAPLFFKLMTSSSNNWMLIKIIKLFGALCPLEPRLGKKLMEPLTNLIHSTSAMSLLYECISTVISGLSDHMPSIQLCVSKLRLLIEDPDQNLKYLGLLALNRILGKVPKAVQPHKDLILQCLDDRDESIRFRALDLIVGMVSKKNLVDIVKKLMLHLERAERTGYRDEILAKIIQICSKSNYQYITNFEWYIDCLLQLSSVENTKHGRLIASQMLDVTIRVKAVRGYAVKKLSSLLEKINVLSGAAHRDGTCEVLHAAAWIAGEFSEHLDDIRAKLESLLHPRASSLPGHIQAVYVQNSFKLYCRIIVRAENEEEDETVIEVGELLREKLPMFTQSSNLEVQERACCSLQIINHLLKLKESDVKVAGIVTHLFSDELIPVSLKAQKKVPVPEGLDLDKWINEPQSDSSDSEGSENPTLFTDNKENDIYVEEKVRYQQPSQEEIEKAREQRLQMQAGNPHYLKMDSPKQEDFAVDNIPVASLELPVKLHINKTGKEKESKKKRKKGRKGKGKGGESDDEEDHVPYEIMTIEEDDMHEDHEDGLEDSDPHKRLNIDLDAPLESHEVLPVRTHRIVAEKPNDREVEAAQEPLETKTKKTKKSKKESTKEKNKAKRSKDRRKEKGDDGNKPSRTKSSSLKKKRARSQDKASSGYAEVSSPTPSKATLLAQAAELKSRGSQNEELDDMDFWLSSTDAPAPQSDAKQDPQVEAARESPENGTPDSKQIASDQNSASPKPEKIKEKKKKEKKERKEKKKSKKVDSQEETSTLDALLMDADAGTDDPHKNYSVLGEDPNLQMLYDIKANVKDKHRVIVSVIFRNLSDAQLISLEFNVLDSLNMKMHRNIGDSSHDPVKVPFQLPPGTTNEGQFAFSVDSIVMPQWLRGTITYFLKRPDGSTSEKIDFKLNFPVSCFIVQTVVEKDYFANLLAGGTLTEKQSMTINIPDGLEFDSVLSKVCSAMHTTVVERAELGASLYGLSMQQHQVLLLVKLKGSDSISVDIKTTDGHLVSSILNEIREVFRA